MTEIPVIDCINIAGDLHGLSDVALEKFTSEFGNALEDKGFVYLSNHGIDMIKVTGGIMTSFWATKETKCLF